MTDKDATLLWLGKFNSEFCEVDHLNDNWRDTVKTIQSPTEALNQLTKRLSDLYCSMLPGKTDADFMVKVFNPIIGKVDVQVEDILEGAPRKTNYKTFVNYLWMTCWHIGAAKERKDVEAWIEIARANYAIGVLEGLIMVEPAVTYTIAARSKTGASKRDAKYSDLRKLAKELAVKRPYTSKRQAALGIKAEILAEASRINVTMSETQAERTITTWLDGMSFGTKRQP